LGLSPEEQAEGLYLPPEPSDDYTPIPEEELAPITEADVTPLAPNNWCHVHNRVARTGSEECDACYAEREEADNAGKSEKVDVFSPPARRPTAHDTDEAAPWEEKTWD